MSLGPEHPPGRASELADRFGTPLYVFDGQMLGASARAFRGAWGDGASVAFSMKCNPLMGVVARLHQDGCWAEVASGFEYRAARRAGVPASQIVFNGPLKHDEEIRRALAEGATLILDGVEQIDAAARFAADAGARSRIGLRLTPPDRIGADRFGFTPAEASSAAERLSSAGLAVGGVHVHLGAYQLGPPAESGPPIHAVTVEYPVPVSRLTDAAAHAVEVADAIAAREFLDLGGGWPAAGPCLEEYVQAVRAVLAGDARQLILEPGRALVRDAGWLLTRVVARRSDGSLVVDAGVTHAPCVLWKRSPVTAAEPRGGAVRPTDIYGPLCLQHDVLARGAPLPPGESGDLIWVGQAGAYAIAQASPFIHLRPGAVLLEGATATLLRARETDDEALGVQAEPLLVGRNGVPVSA
ncbi:MAG: alanine racemase [Thermoleophilia bacterium]|nr:alanine racemase [Thermoleophilia bacterium]